MHQNPWLRQGRVDQQPADALPRALLRFAERMAQVALHVPFGEQLQLTPQQGLVIGRHRLRDRLQLELEQRLDGIVEQLIGVTRVDHVQIGLASEVGQQQEAAIQIGRQHLRYMHTGFVQHLRHLDEGTAVFLGWRRVHHDQAALAALPAEVTTKTGIAARRGELRGRYFAPAATGKEFR